MPFSLSNEHRASMEEFRRRQRSGILVLLFTDMVGSTQLKQDLGDQQAVALIWQHHAIIRRLLEGFPDGKEIDTAGDSFFIVFVKPSDGVKFALLVQAAMRRLALEAGQPIALRIGIHAGEVFIEEKEHSPKPVDLYGIQVDASARVMSLAQGNQVLLTRFVFDNARQLLKGGEITNVGALSWLNHGPYLVKGVEEPMEICEVGEVGAAVLSRPPDSEKAQRHVSADTEPVLGWRPAVGQVVPNTGWVLEQELGAGGFGEVWLGRHEKLKERRVFKFCFRADRVRSLKREVTLFRLLKERGNHPNIVAIQDVFFDEPPFYIMMDYADGEDLGRWSQKQGGLDKVPLEARLEIVAQVADALQAAHEAGIIHRDVKPSNIIVCGSYPGTLQVKLTDFGIGQVVSKDVLSGVTQMGFTRTMSGSSDTGTPMYMAPELHAGKSASTRSDIYSLGVVLYQLLSGDLTRPPTMDWGRDIESPLLKEDLAKCLAGNPQERLAAAQELAQRLRSLPERRLELSRREAEIAEKLRAAHRKGVMRATAVAMGVILLVAGLAIWAVFQSFVAKSEASRAQLNEKTAVVAATETRMNMSASDFSLAVRLIAEDQRNDALAYLARSLSLNPTNTAASTRLATLLASQCWWVPMTVLKQNVQVASAQFSPDGKRIVTASSDGAQVWDAQSGQPLTGPLKRWNPVQSVQFSPDGKRIVTGSGDGVRVWDAQSGQLLNEPVKSSIGQVSSAQFSSDGKRIVTASGDNSARVWDAESGQPLSETLKGAGRVRSAQFSPDGKRIVTASYDETARVWDAQSGQPLTEPMKHSLYPVLFSAQFSPDGKRIVTTSYGGTARVWDARSGHPLTEPMFHIGHAKSLQFSPDGNRIVTTSSLDNTARVWDAQSGKPLTEPMKPIGLVESAQFSPDGKRIATVSSEGAQVWDAQSGQPLTEPMKHSAQVVSLQFSPDGKRIVTASPDGARVWGAQSGQSLTKPLKHGAQVYSARFSPDGQRIVTAAGNVALVWDAQSGQSLTEAMKHDVLVSSAQFSGDGKRIVTTAGNAAQAWDAQSGRRLTEPLKPGGSMYQDGVSSAQFSPDGKRIVTASDNSTARVWDARSGQPLTEPLKHSGRVASAQFSPDGKRIVTASWDSTARVWDAVSGQPLTEPMKHGHPQVNSAQFSADGKWIVTASYDGTARVWDAVSGQPLTEPLKHNGGVISAQFSPDGKRIVTASEDNTARVWDARSGQPLTEPLKHSDRVVSAQFSADGNRIVTASWDKTARVWDARSGQPLTEPLKHRAQVVSAQFSADGKRVVTASYDDTARVWEISPSSTNHPDWLPRLAEAISGQALNKQGLLEPTQLNRAETINQIRQELNRQPDTDDWVVWGRWFLAAPAARTLSPFSKITLLEFIESQIAENTAASLAEVENLALLNPELSEPIAQARNTVKLKQEAEALEAKNKIAEEEAKCVEALELNRKAWPNDPAKWSGYLFALANVRARAGRWKEAAADCSMLVEMEPTNYVYYHYLAPLLVQSGDLEGYRRHCARALAVFGSTKDGLIAERMAKICLILPGSGVDLGAVGQLAETAIKATTNDPSHPFFPFTKGLAEYRQGHFASAVEWEHRVLSNSVIPVLCAGAWAVLTMADCQLKRPDEARDALSKGAKIIDLQMPKLASADLWMGRGDWIIAQALVKEAKEMIASTPPAEQK